ncbi:unnamed protein product [Rotaria sordida]|uniref:HIT-type domain-containing protein n=1 Tax=Rotaria sordida TaxID=392033 RepID=A0A813NA93_9BILA|nr:unnamed protein product [Rotaria sordida]CAF0730017.1 unnamed protein product [Rotaria sordida]CAF0758609.1 unnamed protein product [Rotaria sordida]CAF0796855.1 unnamed protein product [Rotaria sordida]CAF1007376.1 unnamed protein product [Rotaria sordida]
MQCQVCYENKNISYKCSKCRIKYCSVACFQKHKSSETCFEKTFESKSTVEAPITQTQLPIELGDDEESDRLPTNILERIDQSNEVLELLKNRHLRTMIKALDRSINPADDLQKAMMEPIFVQFVDQLLMIVENKDR